MTQNQPPPLPLGAPKDTARLAAAFAGQLGAGDVLLLNGGLAAGKTFFVRAALAALGSKDIVSSPTYTIANLYQCTKSPVLHIDAYRLKTTTEFTDLGLEAELESGICFIEWGAMLEDEFEHWVQIELATGDVETQRVAHFSAYGARGEALLRGALAAYMEGEA
ncbi:MAG: tRNA (adenosine(37)-N6)-threonylcarbamoyltransferase complex ATPase subunit type 1 TsaE [Rhodobacteraceae bacterium]|nr:tRNA (adenosine(37)-N6)-threonylcarbamoyltransferase complex ATPase subunit type 1 TsaE [Paracoccaceae bacterium]